MADAPFWTELIPPLSEGKPCGEDIEASANKVSSLNRKGIFGQQTGIRDPNFDWRVLKSESLEAVQDSKCSNNIQINISKIELLIQDAPNNAPTPALLSLACEGYQQLL